MNPVARAARRGMFRTGDRVEAVKDALRGRGIALIAGSPETVEIANARTSMCDYRCALTNALGVPADRNGFTITHPDREDQQ